MVILDAITEGVNEGQETPQALPQPRQEAFQFASGERERAKRRMDDSRDTANAQNQYTFNVGASTSNAEAFDNLFPRCTTGINLPSHLKDFLKKSIEEYKKMFLAFEKSQAYLKKLREQRAEGTVPNSLRLKPPRLTVQDEQGQAFLNQTLQDLCNNYRSSCLEVLIEAQQKLVENQEKKLDSYCTTFDASLQEILSLMASLELFDSPTPMWHNTIQSWRASLLKDFKNAINNFKVTHLLNAKIKEAAFTKRKAAQDQAMGDAETLPTEPSIAKLVKEQVQKQVQAQVSKLKKSLGKEDKGGQNKQKQQQKDNNKGNKSQQPKKKNGNNQVSKQGNRQKNHNNSQPGKKQGSNSPKNQPNKPKNQQGNRQGGGNQPQRKKQSTPSSAQPSSSRPSRSTQKSGSGQKQNRQGSRSRSAPPSRSRSRSRNTRR